ncbi:ATP-binding cassette domain-containing protein, partial [Candidatus Peregrinibacteria bacterium]|nr:ATP-binding cassette domain-containing protein [Candidatus Peregrinibacteria bacterium]
MIGFSHVTKQYGEAIALSDVTFTVSPKECVCITGPAKAGKSTIIRLLLRAEALSTGSISIDNVDLQLVPPAVLRLYRQRIGLKLAEGNLFLRKTVAENLAFPLTLRALSERDASRAVRSMMERLGLLEHADLRPPHLSPEARTLLG